MRTLFLKSNKLVSIVILGTILLSCNACSNEDEMPVDPPISVEDATEFNAAMAKLSSFDQPNEATQPEETNVSAPERDDQDPRLECTVKTYKLAPGFDEMLTLDPTTDVIYPGATLKGESIPTGEYIGINLDRQPITLSSSLSNIEGSPVVTIEDPKLSTVREGIKQILDQEVTGATPAQVNFEITQVYSEKHLEAAIGVNYRGAGKKVSANIDFSNSQFKNKFVLKFLQQYYTIDMDSPGRDPSDLFKRLPDVNALGSTSPVYVASVAYGRMVIYTIETNSSLTEINSAFSASVGSTDGTIDVEYEETFNSSKIKALVIGGSGEGAVQTINGPAEVYNFISEGGNYSKDSPGSPLSYKLRYIRRDFPIARQVLTSEYPIRECFEAYQKFGVQLYGWNPWAHRGENRLEIYGTMTGKIYQDGAKKAEVKWSRGANGIISWNKQVFYEINENNLMEIELYKPNLQTDYVELFSTFYEANGGAAAEHFGNATAKIFLKDVQANKTPYVRYRLRETSGSEMRTYFYVWRIY